ncbi:hypothetical protein EV126DRAFT_255226 [Verticillium dahliae]|nr:hypothetical protein EV126DRAFT_255226 [Verticillium dahliae]
MLPSLYCLVPFLSYGVPSYRLASLYLGVAVRRPPAPASTSQHSQHQPAPASTSQHQPAPASTSTCTWRAAPPSTANAIAPSHHPQVLACICTTYALRSRLVPPIQPDALCVVAGRILLFFGSTTTTTTSSSSSSSSDFRVLQGSKNGNPHRLTRHSSTRLPTLASHYLTLSTLFPLYPPLSSTTNRSVWLLA